MSVMPTNFQRYGGGSPNFAPSGMNRKRSFFALYSTMRVGIGGRGLSSAVESSELGAPQLAIRSSLPSGACVVLGAGAFADLFVAHVPIKRKNTSNTKIERQPVAHPPLPCFLPQ